MQPTTIAANPALAHDIAAELMALSVLGIKGKVEVEIVDDRTGRIVAREEAPNYVNTAMWSRFAKAIQKLAWTYGYQGDTTTVTGRSFDGRDPRTIPTMRNDLIACWTDATAEDSTDEFPLGEVVAWAHRFQQGSPSTRQGIVQPTLCTLTDSAVSWVWEWASANGNGTFQSVGWRRLLALTNAGDTTLADHPQMSRRTTAVGTNTIGLAFGTSEAWTVGATATYPPAFYDSGSGKWYSVTFTTGNLWKLVSSVITIDAAGNYSAGNLVDESAAAFAAGLYGNSVAFGSVGTKGICRLGAAGDWISSGYTGSGTARRPSLRRVTNAGVVTYTNANAATYTVESAFHDVTYDGTNLYVIAKNGATGANIIHRVDPATGTISATLTISGTPAYFPTLGTTRSYNGIEWDAGRACLWITTYDGYLFNVTTSGVWEGVLLSDTPSEMPPNPGTLSGQHNGFRMSSLGILDVDSVQVQFAGATNSAQQTTWPGSQSLLQNAPANLIAPSHRGRLFTMDGNIWAAVIPTVFSDTAYPAACAFEELPSFSTRSLLASSVTKNSTQTMRIRYTMTFT